MSKAGKPPGPAKKVLGLAGYQAVRNRLLKAEKGARQAAETNPKSVLLRTGDVAGEYDFARALTTTLGGVRRQITLDDLRHFEAVTRRLGQSYKGGITARQVIDHSMAIDRERSQAQIAIAPLVRLQHGLLTFVTNAGPDSEFQRHIVRVRFPRFAEHASDPKADADKEAKALLAGQLQLDCSCLRHRFVLRYIATRGNFNIGPPLGRDETAFPKVTNPTLEGIACKHALRVMQQIVRGTAVVGPVANAIRAAQKNSEAAIVISAAQIRAEADRQLRQVHHLLNRVESQAERNIRLGRPATAGQRSAVGQSRRRAPLKRTAGGKDLTADQAVDALSKVGALSPAQISALQAILKAQGAAP